MNRRSFITKALAGIAAVPLLRSLKRKSDGWTHYNVVRNGDAKVYLNGEPIGYWPAVGYRDALVFDPKFVNRPLTDEEIQGIYDYLNAKHGTDLKPLVSSASS